MSKNENIPTLKTILSKYNRQSRVTINLTLAFGELKVEHKQIEKYMGRYSSRCTYQKMAYEHKVSITIPSGLHTVVTPQEFSDIKKITLVTRALEVIPVKYLNRLADLSNFIFGHKNAGILDVSRFLSNTENIGLNDIKRIIKVLKNSKFLELYQTCEYCELLIRYPEKLLEKMYLLHKADGSKLTKYNMDYIEALELLKIDFKQLSEIRKYLKSLADKGITTTNLVSCGATEVWTLKHQKNTNDHDLAVYLCEKYLENFKQTNAQMPQLQLVSKAKADELLFANVQQYVDLNEVKQTSTNNGWCTSVNSSYVNDHIKQKAFLLLYKLEDTLCQVFFDYTNKVILEARLPKNGTVDAKDKAIITRICKKLEYV